MPQTIGPSGKRITQLILWGAEEKKYNKPLTYNIGGITVC